MQKSINVSKNGGFTSHYGENSFWKKSTILMQKDLRIKSQIEGHSAGFTLLELILVTFLVGVLFSISITAIDNLIPEYRLRAAQREIADNSRLAKTHAASLSKDIYLQYDLSNNDYWLLVPLVVEKDKKKYIEYETLFYKRLAAGVTFESLILPLEKNSKVTTGTHTIKFSPFGFSGYHIVNLQGDGNSKGAVKVNGLTGAISYFDETQSEEKLLQDE